MKEVELTPSEIGLITSALNAYWNDANYNLTQRKDLGDIEKIMYEKQKELTYPLLMKFENL